MRLFTAINLSDRSRQLLLDKVNILKNNIEQDLKWVDPENWHVTLKFLGDTKKEKAEKVKEDITQIASFNKSFPVILNKVGAFPHLNHPKVLYVGVNEGFAELTQIQEKLENKLYERGYSRENRRYTPHLTLARSRKNTNFNILSDKLKNFAEKNNFIKIYFKADRISLMKSELTSQGPIYEEVFAKNLQ